MAAGTQRANVDVVVLGGGAAGLMAAFEAGRRGRRVVLLEHGERVGRKILISGGGRCNFTNLRVTAENFLSANPHFAKSALARFTPAEMVELVRKHGIRFHEKTLGQLFCDDSARQIVTMLLQECGEAGVWRCGAGFRVSGGEAGVSLRWVRGRQEPMRGSFVAAAPQDEGGFRCQHERRGTSLVGSLVIVATAADCRFRRWGRRGWGMTWRGSLVMQAGGAAAGAGAAGVCVRRIGSGGRDLSGAVGGGGGAGGACGKAARRRASGGLQSGVSGEAAGDASRR